MRTFTLLSLAVFLIGSSTGPTLQGQVFVVHSSLSTHGALPQPPRDRQQAPPTGTAVIRGRVVSVDTGQPLRRVQIRATAPELKEQRLTTTDEQGRFELKELPTGRYSLSATKGGYVTLQYGQRRPLEPGRPIELANGQVLDKVDFNLPRGSAITGRILDEFGESVTGARVQVLRYRFVGGQRPIAVGADSTDDLGQFRAFGLPPGDYYVSATLQMQPFVGLSDDRSGYSATYFPGTPSISEAQRVTVGAGQELSGITFSLMPSRTASIRGVVLDSSGKPLSSAMIMLIQAQDGLGSMMTGAGQSRPDGSFTLSNIVSGDYVVQARPMNAGPDSEAASARLTVAGDDVTGLTLVMTKGATARGQIVFDDGQAPSSLKPSEVQILSTSQEQILTFSPGRNKVSDDWTFEMAGLMGERLIRAFAPSGWALKAVTYEGNDVTDSPINFGTSGEIAGIQIVLTQQQTDISGMVTDSRGNVVKDYVVVMFAEDSARWGFQTRFIRSGRPDQDGRFKIRGLPPERYLAVAVDYLEPGEETNPETLEQLKPLATSFGLKAAEARALDLKLSKY